MPSLPEPTTASPAPGRSAGGRPPPDRHGGLWRAPAAVVTGFLLGLLATLAVEIVGHAFGSSLTHPSPAVLLVGNYVFDLAFVLAALYFSRPGGLPDSGELGLRSARLRRAAAAFALGAVVYYGGSLAYAAATNPHATDRLPSDLGINRYAAALIAATVFVCVFAPICEELFFRGFLFGTLMRMRARVGRVQLGPWIAAVSVAVLFGLAHIGSAPAPYLVPLGFLGFVLCMIRWRTGSIYPCIALHSLNNCVALGVQRGWNAGVVLGLIAGSWAAIGLLTGPFARRAAPAGAA
jgi:membrane protease YdiL (CAAX protease family)